MPDIKDISTVGGIAGLVTFAMGTIQFLWNRGDREERRMAALIQAKDGPINKAVCSVAVAGVEDSGRFVSQSMYDEQRATRDEKLDKLSDTVDDLSRYVRSDQLPKAIANAIAGSPTRRLHVRDQK